ncbi:MAG: transglutaminase domain-containing protein, partial [Deltaproteobacteria bacterium]|nr:transglutaminase domain-containing protein [Deltaproteobacteria bacterium]
MSPSWAPPGEAAPEFLDASSVTKGAAGERLKSLIADVLKGRATEIEKARAIEAHLLGGYGYSLDPKKGTGLSPLDDFLFFSKQGYCEHYATAMAMMLRAAGIPARIVIGFSEGEWNGYGGYFIVRQSDAHSWVEARIKGMGWMTFDPTPSSGFTAYGRPARLGLYLDMLRFRWDRYIVNYTLADQKRLTGTIESLTSRLYFSVKRWWILGVRSTVKRLNAVSTLAAALLAAWAFFRLRKKRAGPTASKTPAYYR